MDADEEAQFGPVDSTPRAPYRPSERRAPLDNSEGNRQDWHCSPPRSPVSEPAVNVGDSLQLRLRNVVSSFAMNCQVDLQSVAQRARNTEYNPGRLPAVIVRLRDPKTTALIFESGKTICTGAKDEQQSEVAAQKFVQMIRKLGYRASFQNFEIQNIVATVDVQFNIWLFKLKCLRSRDCSVRRYSIQSARAIVEHTAL